MFVIFESSHLPILKSPNRITATIMASSFLSLAELLTWPGFFFALALICLVSAIFLYKYLPETKGKSLEEMSSYFASITGDRSILDAEDRLHHQHDTIAGTGDMEMRGFYESVEHENRHFCDDAAMT